MTIMARHHWWSRILPRIIGLATVVLVVGSIAFAQASVGALAGSPCSQYIQEQTALSIAGIAAGEQLKLSVDKHDALLILPKHVSQSVRVPWVWFAPMVAGEPNEHHQFIIEHILNAGMAFAAIDVGESYGNPAGTLLYAEFHDVLNRCFNLSRKAVLFPQSRGGLMLFNWAVKHTDEIQRIAGIYPVCDLRSYPGLKTASEAYGMSEMALGAQLEEHNPIDFVSKLASAKIPILMIHGDTDKLVPLQENSAEFVRRYQRLGGPATLVVVHGKGHEEVDEFFKSTAFITFVTSGNLRPTGHM